MRENDSNNKGVRNTTDAGGQSVCACYSVTSHRTSHRMAVDAWVLAIAQPAPPYPLLPDTNRAAPGCLGWWPQGLPRGPRWAPS